jgi:hypothetical protein
MSLAGAWRGRFDEVVTLGDDLRITMLAADEAPVEG